MFTILILPLATGNSMQYNSLMRQPDKRAKIRGGPGRKPQLRKPSTLKSRAAYNEWRWHRRHPNTPKKIDGRSKRKITSEQRRLNRNSANRRWSATPHGKILTALKGTRRRAKRFGYMPCDPATVRPPYDNLCDHCWQPTTKLYLDHDHATGRFRGWLCNSCNLAFGYFGDNVEGMTTRNTLSRRTPR